MDPKTEQLQLLQKTRTISDKALAERRDFTAAERRTVEANLERVKQLRDQDDRVAKSKREVDQIEAWLSGDGGPIDQDALNGTRIGDGRSGGRNVKAALANFASTAADAITGRKATVNPQGGWTAATPFVTGTKEEVIGPDPNIGILGLIQIDEKTFTDTNQFAYLRERTRINNAAVVPDGAKKPVSEYELEEVTDKLKFIAHISTPIPARYLEDYGALKDYLQTVMGRDLYRVIGDELVTGNGDDTHLHGILNLSGVQQTAYATDLPTTLRKARTTLSLLEETPTAWLMNPTDIEAIELTKDGQGRFQSLREVMGGLPMIPSTALAAGTAVLGDWRQAKMVMRSGDGVRLTAMDGTPHYAADGTIDGSLWEYNEVAIRAEIRAGGLAVTRPKAFTVVDLVAT